jgi:outer membrane protein
MNLKKALHPGLTHAILGFTLMLPVSAGLAAESDTWDVTLGAGVASFPKYPGSQARRVEALPMVGVRYGRFFIGAVPGAGIPAGLGAYLYEDSHWKLGVTLGGDIIKPRKESDDSRHLRGLGDINSTIRGGAFVSYTLDWFMLGGSAQYDLEDHHNHEGLLASLEAIARYSPLARLTLTAGPGVTFANQRYMQTFFGIDALQAQRSAYAEYTPKAGVATVGFSLGAGYELTSHWSLGARVAAERLQGDAARSPIVENKSQNVYALYAIYKF